jgi:hypothetical protein
MRTRWCFAWVCNVEIVEIVLPQLVETELSLSATASSSAFHLSHQSIRGGLITKLLCCGLLGEWKHDWGVFTEEPDYEAGHKNPYDCLHGEGVVP